MNQAFARPLGEQVDDGVVEVSQKQLQSEVRGKMADWVCSAAPENLDALREEPLMVDALRELQTALLHAKHPYETAVIEALSNLHCVHFDQLWDMCGGGDL